MQTKQQRINELTKELESVQGVVGRANEAMQHVAAYARGIESGGTEGVAPAEFGEAGWSESLEAVKETIGALRWELQTAQANLVLAQAKNTELRGDIEQKQRICHSQAKALEDSELKRQLLAKACQRRHEAIEIVLDSISKPGDEDSGEPLSDLELKLLRAVMSVANID
jgi:hypothetical protein